MERCELCGKEAKSLAGLKAHMRMKHMPDDESAPVVVPKKELEKYNLPRGPMKVSSIRTVKMVAPLCDVCTDGIHARDWFNTCPHEPYFHAQEVPEIVEDRDYQPDGTYIVRNRQTVHRVRQMPNLRQLPHSPRHLGVSVRRKINKGWVFPEQIGVAAFCQALDCWSQDLPERWISQEGRGVYCSPEHALPSVAQELNIILEVGDGPEHRRKRQEQLAKINFR